MRKAVHWERLAEREEVAEEGALKTNVVRGEGPAMVHVPVGGRVR